MGKILLFAFLLTLASCETLDVLTIGNGQIYCNKEAVVAYDLYNEFYKNDIIETKPFILIKNGGGD